ncbi:MAG: hypothetical protein AAGJ82_16030, partial [Bacteroidota bacterium]
MNRFLLLISCCLRSFWSLAQVEVVLVVESGTASSDCTDPILFGDPDPLFSVSVEGIQGAVYPEEGVCYTALPDTAWRATYA